MQHLLVTQQLLRQEQLREQEAGTAGAAAEADKDGQRQQAPAVLQAAISLSPMLVAALQEQYERNRQAMLAVQAGAEQQVQLGEAAAAGHGAGDGARPTLVQVGGRLLAACDYCVSISLAAGHQRSNQMAVGFLQRP